MKEIKIGDRSGSLTVVDLCVRVPNKRIPTRNIKFIKCKCDCGGTILARPTDWNAGKYKKCKDCGEPNPLKEGQRFGKLTVIKRVDQKEDCKSHSIFYLCKCDCGKETVVAKGNLTSGNIKSCGCGKIKHEQPVVGKKFGKLTITKKLGYNRDKKCVEYLADCDCGTKNYVVNHNILVRAKIPSCGCTNRFGTMRFKEEHPELIPFLDRAKAILDRCRVPACGSFHNYGGRGIKCEMGNTQTEVAYSISRIPGYFEGAELDRIDNDGNYTLWDNEYGYNVWVYHDDFLDKDFKAMGNLRWVTPDENNSNTIRTALKEEDIWNRLQTYNAFHGKVKALGLKLEDFVKREATFANQKRYKNAIIGDDKLYLFVPKSWSEEQRENQFNKFQKIYEECEKARVEQAYSYSLTSNTSESTDTNVSVQPL